jgi:hypothetical protein
MASWKIGELMEHQVDEMVIWWKGKLVKWQIDQNVKLTKIASWQNSKLTKLHVDEIASW